MKATSKLISVVLILAMCLSMFTVSAFASGTVVLAPMEEPSSSNASGAVFEGTYVSPDAETEVETDDSAVQAASASAPAAEDVIVNDAASLIAAANRGGKVQLGSDITMSESLVLANGTALNLKGKTLTFSNGASLLGAALIAKGSASVSNGLLVVEAREIPDANGNSTKSGFASVASAEGGLITLNGVGVFFNAPQTMNIFGSGVALAYGSYNRDVSAYANFEAFDMGINADGRYVLTDKAPDAAVESDEAVAANDSAVEAAAEAAPAEETASEENPAAEEAAAEEAAEAEAAEAEAAEEVPAEEPAAAEEAQVEAETSAEEAVVEVQDAQTAEEDETAAEEVNEPADAETPDGEAAEDNAEDAVPASDEQIAEEAPVDAQPVDETPVDIVEEEEKTYEEEVRVSEEEEASEEGLVTLTGTDPVSGAVVTVVGKNLPEGLTVVVKALSTDMLGGLEEGEHALLALDITLVDAEGNEYEPKDDPNVGAVTVSIQHSSLENLDEAETLALYHVVDGDVVETVASAQQQEDSSLAFATGSFSPFVVTAKTGAGTVYSGSTGEAHKKVISIKNTSGDIYVIGDGSKDLTFEISGGAAPESISIIDPDNVSSGNASVYKAGLLLYDTDYKFDGYDPSTDTTIPDPLKVIIKGSAIKNAPTGKWAVVFWFKDTTDTGSTRVYMVQYITIVPKVEIRAISPLDEDGNIFFEKCDYDPVEIFLTADLKSFAIKDKEGNMVAVWEEYKDKDKVKVNTTKYPNKTYYASEMFSVSDYITTDAVGHEFIAGKTLKLNRALLQKLDFGSDYTITVAQENKQEPYNAASATFKMTMVPGIAVADGLNDYIKGKNVWIKFIACAPIDYDDDGTLAIWIGGQKISHDYYSISNDHQTLWIYRNLLDQLRSNNSYTLTARLWRSENGKKVTYYPATAQFNILAAGSTSYKSPKTGDNSNIGLWAAVLVLSGGAVVALIPKKKRVSK